MTPDLFSQLSLSFSTATTSRISMPIRNERRSELWSGMSDWLRALLPKALSVLERSVENGDVKAAVAVLRAAGLHGLSAPEGPMTVEDAQIELRERAATRPNRSLISSLT